MRLVVIDWKQSRRFDGWQDLDSISMEPSSLRSVGWLLRDDDEKKVVVSHWDPDDNAANGIMVIPAGTVVSMKDLEATL